MDFTFIGALVQAGMCCHHAPIKPMHLHCLLHTSNARKPRKKDLKSLEIYSQAYHTYPAGQARSLAVAQEFDQDDYKSMLDYYSETYRTKVPAPSLDVVVLGLPDIEEPMTGKAYPAHNSKESESSRQERQLIESFTKSLEDMSISNEQLYKSYQTLAFPGVSHLSSNHRRALLRRLSAMEKRNEAGTLRFLSVIDDMKAADLPLKASEWSSAVHLAGRCFGKVSDLEVEVALRTWKEMEQEAGVEGKSITFNILFDIAVKAGKFGLADMILQELQARKLELRRFAYVGLIYYYGVKGDGDGVRKAYRDLVDAGQIVDTVVLNCVIASLLRADEPAAAEQVYERMKMMHARSTGRRLPSNDWKGSRELGRMLDRAARLNRDSEEHQDKQSLSPNVHTYEIFLAHHVSSTGELQRVVALLDEMQFLGLPVYGRLYMEVFRGFANHGGVRYTTWTSTRLESVWQSFLQSLAMDREKVYIGKWVAIWIVRAFAKCTGRIRTLEIWNELRSRWKPALEEEAMISGILEKAVRDQRQRSTDITR